MGAHLEAFCIDAADPAALAAFWAGLFERPVLDVRGAPAFSPSDDTGFLVRFVRSDLPRRRPNRFHPDLTSRDEEDMAATVDRALRLGATPLDVGQGPDARHVVLADPEGNELCVLPPGNRFLAGCPRLGALAGDGSRATGLFWRDALGWPLVWDEGEETAIQSPSGGPKITWGGPPFAPKHGKSRVHLDLVAEGDLGVEVDRLLGLGASPADIGQGDVPWRVLADPDGTEFCVLPAAAAVDRRS